MTRHREITSKAVSAILLLTLKWFKMSRELLIVMAYSLRCSPSSDRGAGATTDVMKFHHLGQLLLDTNCLLLILKIFGLQEVSTAIVSKADMPEHK